MYAIIHTGGKQYRVKIGQQVRLEKLAGDVGSAISFDQIVFIAHEATLKVGTPYIEHARVKGEIVEQGRGEKVRILKFKRRKHSMKCAGHRQAHTVVKILAIET